MSEISQRIANLSPAQRVLLEKRLSRAAVSAREPIAIVGAACRVPGANDLASFWSLLRGGVDAITLVPTERWDADSLFDQDPSAAGKISSRWGGFIADADRFDASFFGVSPREAMQMDPQQRILLEVACDALDNAGLIREELSGSRMGVFVGVHGHASDYLLLQNRDLNKLDSFSGTGVAHNLMAGRLAYFLDSHGPAVVIDTACSSSLVALHMAVQSIRLGESSSALVGGINLILTPNFTVAASRMHMLAPDGRCKAFDQRADGFVRSEGCGVVVLKSLSEAVACGDSILAVVRGSAINQDGHTNGITAPNGLAQRQVIERALSDANVAGDQIGFVEAHGTGTALGDPIEFEALSATVGIGKEGVGHCFVGSVKTNIGHLEGAAGIVGLIKASLVLHHGEIPPNLHFTGPNPHIRVAGTRLKFPVSLERWGRGSATRRAAVSSFGWSGTNAHVILEEAPVGDSRLLPASHDVRLLPISAHSPEALVVTATRMRDRLCADPPIEVDDLSLTAALRRSHHLCRIAVVGRSIADFARGIDVALNGRRASVAATKPPSIAFVFPGHGAQWSGMGQALLQTEPVFRDAMERCDAAIQVEAGWSLLEQIQASTGSSLIGEARIAQPALFAFGVALSELWKSWGVTPAAVIGHSMGEVAACYVAGALSLVDATRIICRRSALLQKVADRGGMLLVEMSREEAQQEIARFEGQLSVGAINGPRSTVLAGDHRALEKISAELVARNVFCRIVKGSPPGHSHLVQPLTASLLADIATVRASTAQISIYSTVTAEAQNGEFFDAAYWGRNFREPVQLLGAVQALLRDGFDTLIEIGPHPILSAVLRDISSEATIDAEKTNAELREAIVLPSLRREDNDHETLYGSLGKIYEQGARVDWARVVPKSGKVVALPSYAWQRQRYWLERPSVSIESRASLSQSGQLHDNNEDRPDVEEWLYGAEWTEAEPWPSSLAPSGYWIVLADGPESADFAAALAANIRAAGGGAQIISGDVGAAVALEVARTGRRWEGIIHCAALDATPNAEITPASLSANPVPGAQTLLEAVRTLDANKWDGQPKLWIVTRGATAVGVKDRSNLAIAQAAMTGLARVVQAEHPTRLGAWVDADPAATLHEQAAQVVAELLNGGDEPALALRDNRRYVQRLLPLAKPTAGRAPEFRFDSSYLITGGLGGIGSFVARWLIKKGARHLLIVGRTPIPPRSEWRVASDVAGSHTNARVATILELESLGASICYEAVDVGDADAMSRMLARWHDDARPPIRGAIHTAAVIDDQLLTELHPRSIDQVFRAKAVGAWVLDSLLPNLDWMVFFSSLASIWPAPGHANYAAANAFLDALAYNRTRSERHGLSVSWGLWTDIGFAATAGGREAQRRFAELGVNGFTPADALRALDILLACSVPHAAVLNADRDMLANRHIDGHPLALLRDFSVSPGDVPKSVPDGFLGILQGSEVGERLALMQQRIKKHVEELLKLENVRLDTHRPLGEYGLNSIMGLELRHRLERDVALRLPATLAWNYPTIAAMAEHLLSCVDGNAGALGGGDHSVKDRYDIVATGDLGARIAQIGALSDEDILVALRATNKEDLR